MGLDPMAMQAILMGNALSEAQVGGLPFFDFRDSMLDGQLEAFHWMMSEGDDTPYA